MKDEEIKKALECCKNGNPCSSCPYNGKCTDEDFNDNYLIKDVIALITRQQAEIERLETELKAMRGAANSYKAEVERLEKDLTKCKLEKEMLHQTVSEIRANAIKEFVERLENNLFNCDVTGDRDNVGYITSNVHSIINNLVKEMTEGGVKNG